MNHAEMSERLECLERSVRRHRLMAGVAVAAAAAGAGLGFTAAYAPTDIEATAFILVDAAGRRTASLSMHPDGYPVLAMNPTGDSSAVLIGASIESPVLSLAANGEQRIGIFGDKSAAAVLAFGPSGAHAGLATDLNESNLSLRGPGSSKEVEISASSKVARMDLMDGFGFIRARFVNDGTNVGLFAKDGSGKIRWAGGLLGDYSSITLADGAGQMRAIIATESDGMHGDSGLFVADASGNPILAAGSITPKDARGGILGDLESTSTRTNPEGP